MKTITYPGKSLHVVKKWMSLLFFLMVLYVLPLAGNPQLLVQWQVILLAIICVVLHATQPRLSIKESTNKKATDRGTMLLIISVSGIGQVVSLVEWAYAPSAHHAGLTISGIVLLIGGTLFRLYAIHTLGQYFTSTVQIKMQHKIITRGPYKFLRHPSYTGAFAAMMGSAILLHSIAGLLFFVTAMLYVYRLRIHTEEKTLIRNFGDAYINYCKHTWKMLPLIW